MQSLMKFFLLSDFVSEFLLEVEGQKFEQFAYV